MLQLTYARRSATLFAVGMDSDSPLGRIGPTAHVDNEQVRIPIPAVLSVPGVAASSKLLRSGRWIVGASPNADFILEHETVSREHIAVELVPEGVKITDLGSLNGTFYAGHRVSEIVLAVSSRLRLGRTELCVEFDTESLEHVGTRQNYGPLEGRSLAKDLIARTIHKQSGVTAGPWVAVNCGALDRHLVRSELFGHRKGAFTGAVESRLGAFQQASGGTLFLDEVGELPLDVQPVLLRALQEREVVPVGETTPQAVNVRLIAASHRDLADLVSRGEFREDLYYRINVVRLTVPPLRERPEDILPLAQSVATRLGVKELPASLLAELKAHPWPGNVRELNHAVEAFIAVGELPVLRPQAMSGLEKVLADHIDVDVPYNDLKQKFMDLFQSAYLQQLLAKTGGNISHAARLSGLERSYLSRLVGKQRPR
jgi:Sigma-54 interaction domain/Inner membrane component of T3SS, cytoplasmic domain/Bacterial regulatory protein, Fis family